MHQTSSHRSVLIDIDRKSRALLAYSHGRRNVKNIKCGLPQSRASVVWHALAAHPAPREERPS
jgi:hypothetical protein